VDVVRTIENGIYVYMSYTERGSERELAVRWCMSAERTNKKKKKTTKKTKRDMI
jgi:hypothetical protein